MLVVGAVCLLGWLAVKVEGVRTRSRAQQALESVRAGEPSVHAVSTPTTDGDRPWDSRPAVGEVIGRIEIPARAVRAPVLAGATEAVLRRAVGHLPETALPGEEGNCVLAGHRDSVFSGLRDVEAGDVVHLETLRGDLTYVVRETEVVPPDASRVLAAGKGETLTLITCYPFTWVGPAPHRWVVTAERAPS